MVARKKSSFLTKHHTAATRRFPLLFTLLGTFGLVATFYGFEHLIDKIPYLASNPVILLLVGLGILALTGTLHKRLDPQD